MILSVRSAIRRDNVHVCESMLRLFIATPLPPPPPLGRCFRVLAALLYTIANVLV